MTKRTPIFVVFALLTALLAGGGALAQSTQNMNMLTEQERNEYTRRLQQATSSADRARITAEMNRVVQQRRLELRQQHQEQQQIPGVNQGQGRGGGYGGGQGSGNGGGKGKR